MFPEAQGGDGPAGRVSMGCRSGRSAHLKMFSAEIGVHYPGLKNLDEPVVWVFPSLLVCLDCGFTELSIPEEQRQELRRLDSEPTQGFVRAG
jgi:hypothetical protein